MATSTTFKTPDQLVLAELEKLPIDQVVRELFEHIPNGIVTVVTDVQDEAAPARWSEGVAPSSAIDTRLRYALADVPRDVLDRR